MTEKRVSLLVSGETERTERKRGVGAPLIGAITKENSNLADRAPSKSVNLPTKNWHTKVYFQRRCQLNLQLLTILRRTNSSFSENCARHLKISPKTKQGKSTFNFVVLILLLIQKRVQQTFFMRLRKKRGRRRREGESVNPWEKTSRSLFLFPYFEIK